MTSETRAGGDEAAAMPARTSGGAALRGEEPSAARASGGAAARGEEASAARASGGAGLRGEEASAPHASGGAGLRGEEASAAHASGGTAARGEEASAPHASGETLARVGESATGERNGYLSVAVLPFAEVLVDGHVVGTTPLRNLPLRPGAHTVEISNAGLRRHTRRTERIDAGAHRRIQLDWSN